MLDGHGIDQVENSKKCDAYKKSYIHILSNLDNSTQTKIASLSDSDRITFIYLEYLFNYNRQDITYINDSLAGIQIRSVRVDGPFRLTINSNDTRVIHSHVDLS